MKFQLYKYQNAWINDASRFKIALKARQIGFTTGSCFEAIDLALEQKCKVLILSATERQSQEVIDKIQNILRVFKRVKRVSFPRENRSEVMLPHGSRIISLPASPASVRSYSGHVFLDEFAFHRDAKQIWRAMLPIITTGYKIRVLSTPAGKSGKFYDLWQNAEARGFSRHRVDIYDAKRDGFPVNIDELKRVTDPDDFAQEYECVFLDEVHSYFPMDLIISNISAEYDRWSGKTLGSFYAGVDIGRKKDRTVIYLVEKLGDVFQTRKIIILEKKSFSAQKRVIRNVIKDYPLHRMCIDSTGLGMQLAEELQREFSTIVEPVSFTLKVKEELATYARMIFENRQIRIPDDQELIRDIHSIKKIVTVAGNVRFDADRNEHGHADRFWAMALALHAANKPGGKLELVSRMRRKFPALLRGYS